jgi:glutathione S-transferase
MPTDRGVVRVVVGMLGSCPPGSGLMSLRLCELVSTDAERPFSPYCWRTWMALAHKGLEARSIPWRFTEKGAIAAHRSDKVPVLLHGENPVVDSWMIANYLEDSFADRPSLFGGDGGRNVSRLINCWGDIAIVGGIFPMIVADIASHLGPLDVDYFRKSREARLGRRLEDVTAERDKTVLAFQRSLEPMRQSLKAQPYLGGAAPNYADDIVFGGFQWVRVVSPFTLLEADDPIYTWRRRLLDAFDGLARKSPGYPV